jgi:hypothetical protein
MAKNAGSALKKKTTRGPQQRPPAANVALIKLLKLLDGVAGGKLR